MLQELNAPRVQNSHSHPLNPFCAQLRLLPLTCLESGLVMEGAVIGPKIPKGQAPQTQVLSM